MSIHEKFYSQGFRDITRFYKESEADKQVEFVEQAVPLKPGEKVLDLACGYGRHSIILARKGYCVTGYDLSADYIREAKQAVNKGMNVDLATGCAIEVDAFAMCYGSPDAKEGTSAFLEKRKAEFKGGFKG